MELVSLYPYDSTGRAASNRITNESVTVIPPTEITDYSYVIPRAAPFFADTLIVKDGKSAGARVLTENVDYWCVIDFLSASIGLNRRISVGIALMDPAYSGTLYVSYQTLGGNYALADYSLLEELIRKRYVVKHVSYEQLVNLPAGFAPEWHKHEIGDMVSMSQVVDSLGGIKTAIGSREGSYGQLSGVVNNHINSANAHSPDQVGLGNVKNYALATLTDVRAGASNRYVTADILKQFVTGSQTDTTGYLTKATADQYYVTKISLTNYLTTTDANNTYALKSDTYTKSQVEALVSGIDVSGDLAGVYTKSESDTKFVSKVDISQYIKETVADGRYATKTAVYDKNTSDTRYAYKADAYTKIESDGRYLTTSNLGTSLVSYLLKTEADSKYVPKTTHDLAISTLNGKIGFIKDISFNPKSGATPAQLVINEDRNGVNKTHTTNLTFMNDYLTSTQTYSRDEVNTHLRRLLNAVWSSALTYEVSFIGVGQLVNGATFPVTWVCSFQGNRFDFTVYNNVAFYGREGSITIRTSDFSFSASQRQTIQMRNFNLTMSSTNTTADGWFRGFSDSYMYWHEGINQIGVDTAYNVSADNKNDYVGVRCYNVNFSIIATDEVWYTRLYNFIVRAGDVKTYVPNDLKLEFK